MFLVGMAAPIDVVGKNLNAIETALAYRELQEKFGLKHHEIAHKVGKNRSTISNAMRIQSRV